MPNACSVPKCGSNRRPNGPAFHTFSFPRDDELRQKWLEILASENFKPTVVKSYHNISAKHFPDYMIQKGFMMYTSDGRSVFNATKRWSLVKGAYPTIFRDYPKEQQRDYSKRRGDPLHVQDDEDESSSDSEELVTLQDIAECDKDEYSFLGWTIRYVAGRMQYFKVSFVRNAKIVASFSLGEDLVANVFYDDTSIDLEEFPFLGGEGKCNTWEKIRRLIVALENFDKFV